MADDIFQIRHFATRRWLLASLLLAVFAKVRRHRNEGRPRRYPERYLWLDEPDHAQAPAPDESRQ